MPLLDHFRPPLAPERRWQSFHTLWATEIVANLNRSVLPEGYFAEAQIHIGSRVEVDVATLESASPRASNGVEEGGVAVEVWSPPVAAMVMPTVFPDEIEVQVLESSGGATLVAAVDLISPGNKDRPETRRAFAAKCLSYLQMGIGLVIVDVVTSRPGNLHDDLVALWGQPPAFRYPGNGPLYTTAYRPTRLGLESGDGQVEVWPHGLSLGTALPVVPLALRRGPTLPLDLDAAYNEARLRSRL